MNHCKHGYVVRNIMGANRFLCKECNERYLHHPGLIKTEDQDTPTPHPATMQAFREGLITFAETIKDATLTTKDFLEAIQTAFPPIVNMELCDDLNGGRAGIVTSVEPQRTSCPKEIEDFFGDPNITTTDIQNMFDCKLFPDIVELTHDHSIDAHDPLHDPYRTSVMITFVDDTQQLVYLYPKGHIKS